MADPTFDVSDITTLSTAESTTNWSQIGQMNPSLNTDFFLQGSSAVAIEPKTNGQATLRFNNTSTIDCVNKHIRVWVNVISKTMIDTLANHGASIRVYDGGGSLWGSWDIGGSDAGEWIGKGYTMKVVDCDRAFDRAVMDISVSFVDSNPDTITRSAGSFITDGFTAGDALVITGTVSNNNTYTIASGGVAATTLTLIGGDAVTVEGPVTATIESDHIVGPVRTAFQYFGINIQVVDGIAKTDGLSIDRIMLSASADSSDATGGVIQIQSPEHTGSSDLDFNDNGGSPDTIVRPSGSWITDGFEVGDTIVVSSTTSNNIEMVITAVVALTIDVATGTITDEQNTSGNIVAVITRDDIIRKDFATDDTAYGFFIRDANGQIETTGKHIFGDFSGANKCILRDQNEIAVWADNPVSTDYYEMIIHEDTGTTEVVFGTEVGTGNNSKGVSGGVMKKNEEVFTFDFGIKATDASPIFRWFGGIIDGASSGVLLQQTDVKFVSCLITRSAQITLESGAEMREGFITNSTEPSGVGAIKLIANPTDPEFRDMQLLNNIHAMENEVNGPLTWDLRNIQFAGNTADIRFNHSSGLLTISVLELGDTPTTSDGGAGGTITVVNNVTLDVLVVEGDFTTINVGSRVAVHLRVTPFTQFMNEETDGTGHAICF